MGCLGLRGFIGFRVLGLRLLDFNGLGVLGFFLLLGFRCIRFKGFLGVRARVQCWGFGVSGVLGFRLEGPTSFKKYQET